MELVLERCTVRSWREEDAEGLPELANNRKIWLNLRDLFPHPYTPEDAREFIRRSREMIPEMIFAIDVGGRAVGSIGFGLRQDVERVSAEIGYWLGEPYWGRGIMTEVLTAVTDHAIRAHHLTRVFALPYEWNPASHRVLEKAGYRLEGRLRKAVVKDGKVIDQMLYAYVVGD